MRRPLLSLVLLFALASSASAAAATGTQAIVDCNAHGKLTSSYSIAALRNALATMPADVKEYTNCSDVIQRALLGQLAGRHIAPASGSGHGSGSFLPTWLIVVLALLVLGAVAAGALSARRRRAGP